MWWEVAWAPMTSLPRTVNGYGGGTRTQIPWIKHPCTHRVNPAFGSPQLWNIPSPSSAGFLMRHPLLFVSVCVCVSPLRDFTCLSAHIFPHQCASSLWCRRAREWATPRNATSVYLFAFRSPMRGVFGLYWHFYCLLEQIEGVTPSSVDAIFQRRNQEPIDFYLNKCSGNRREPCSRPKGFDIMRPSTWMKPFLVSERFSGL